MPVRHGPRNASTGRAAPRGFARWRGAGGADLGRILLAWLAVLAVVVQTTVPDLAMAARDAARHQAETAAAHQAAHEDHCGEAPSAEAPAPADRHEHETFCAFCLALGTHGLVPAPANVLPVPAAYAAVALPLAPGVRPRPLFLIGHSPRAPPAPQQV